MSSYKSWQGTQTVNNLVVNGSLTVSDIKQIQSNNGLISATNKYPSDVTPGVGVPTVTPFCVMRERPVKTQKVLEFKLLQGDKSEFDAVLTVTSAGVIPNATTSEIYVICAKALVDVPTGAIITTAPASMTNGDIQLSEGQNVFMILEEGTAATYFNVEIYYEVVSTPLSSMDPI